MAFTAFASYLLRPALPDAVLSAEAQNFRDRMSAVLDGQWPYLETLYEHLPLAFPPMLLPRLVPGGEQTYIYTAVFGVLMTAMLIWTGFVVARVARAAGIAAGDVKWAWLVIPIVPIVAFRIDPVPTLLAVAAFHISFVLDRGSGPYVTAAAIAAKGWPLVLAPLEWWRGRRLRGIALFAFTGGLATALLATPGFQEGRDFSGVHLETMAGSAIAWLRTIAGADSGLGRSAGAVYVSAPSIVLAVGAILAALLLLASRSMWRRPVTVSHAAQQAGVLTLALLLASPLLSAQFLLWLTPWLIFFRSRRISALMIGSGLLTTVLLALWGPSELWWQTVLLARNVLLLFIAVEMVRVVAERPAPGKFETAASPSLQA